MIVKGYPIIIFCVQISGKSVHRGAWIFSGAPVPKATDIKSAGYARTVCSKMKGD
jgi:hypothetical protein